MVKESSDLSLRKDKGGGSHSFFFLLVWANSVETSTSSYFLVLTSLMEREDCPSSCFLIPEISLSLTELHPALFWIPWSPWPPRPPQLPRPPLPGHSRRLGKVVLFCNNHAHPISTFSSQIYAYTSITCRCGGYCYSYLRHECPSYSWTFLMYLSQLGQ